MHQKEIITAGRKITEAKKVLIMIHGRGGTAENILSLAEHLDVKDYALIAPQATNNTWYPYSFIAPIQQNEPWLTSALTILGDVVNDLISKGFTEKQLYFLGFSQGACLTLEYITRNPAHYGGVVAFTGGLIGDKIYREHYPKDGSFGNTPIFIGSSDPDMHVPVERVYATTNILKEMQADVTEKIYPNMGHTITQDEINKANTLVFNK